MNKALIIILFLSSMPFSICYGGDSIPHFIVGARIPGGVSLVVEKETHKEQVIALINDLQKARQENNFQRLIPPTTPNGKNGPYALVNVYIVDDEKLGKAENLERYLKSDTNDKFVKKFASSIRGSYFYSTLGKMEEQGLLGNNDGSYKSKDYQKLF